MICWSPGSTAADRIDLKVVEIRAQAYDFGFIETAGVSPTTAPLARPLFARASIPAVDVRASDSDVSGETRAVSISWAVLSAGHESMKYRRDRP